MNNIFEKFVSDKIIKHINNLTTDNKPSLEKMNVAQMLAHYNVTYKMAYENKP